jgi:hypothetical protein
MDNYPTQENQTTEYSVKTEYPVKFEVRYPERSSRLLALLGIPFFLKSILLLPHVVVLYFLNLAMTIVVWFGYWAVLFTGRYPRSFFDFVIGVMRWQNRITAWLYSLTDKYPPFSLQ